jgi:hypothetical protein
MAIHTCLVTYIYLVMYTIYVRPNLVVLVFVQPNSSYVRPKLEVIGQMSYQVKYLFAALALSPDNPDNNICRARNLLTNLTDLHSVQSLI